MQYEHFSRQLRKKYSTRLHVLDQLVDQLKQKNQSSKIDLNENRKVSEPYFNECILTAERMKNNRRSERDRKICYENLILAEKLERIKKQSGQNRKISKANCKHETIFDFKKERTSETEITSYHSPSFIQSENDQATAADVDASIDFTPPILHKKRNHRNFNCSQSMSTKYKDRVYQHLTNIDMTMIRDTLPSQTSKHFSICILPHFDFDLTKSRNDRQYAFKKEILYHDRII